MPIRKSRMSRKEALQQQKRRMTEDDAYGMNTGGLSAGQKKLAAKAPPPNKIDEKDFAVLRAEKAKGRGMGLQDESVKPGKVMKAKMGVATDYKKYLKGLKKATSEVRKEKMENLKKGYFKTLGVFPTVKKKMGGGMIGASQKPGYSKGVMVKARGCKLGRTRPTKIT